MRIRHVLAAAVLAIVAMVPAAPAAAMSSEASTSLALRQAQGPIQAQGPTLGAGDFTFASFSADYYLGRDSGRNATLRTVERLVANFPQSDQNHGIERMLPLTYGEANLELQVVSVTDGNGRPVTYSRNDENGMATLRIGDADHFVHGTRTYVITYTSRNVVRSFADTKADEFYWNTNGTQWAQPFGSVTARIHLADGLAGQLTGNASCYAGASGSTDQCTITRDGDTFIASAKNVDAYQNLTFAIGFDTSAFVDPPLAKNGWLFTVAPWILLALLIGLALWVLWMRVFVWRSAPGRGIIVPEYGPPKGVYPALAAALIKRRKVAFPAEIVSFAVNKIVRIREFPSDPKWKRYELELLTTDTGVLLPREVQLLKNVFGKLTPGRKQRLDRTDRELGDRMSRSPLDARSDVRAKRLRVRPVSRVPAIVRWSLLLIAALAIALSWYAGHLAVESDLVSRTVIAAVVGGIVVFIFAGTPWVLSTKGTEIRDHLRGMRMYIRLAEADRIRVLQSVDAAERIDVTDRSAVIALYEKVLPYAMILRVDKTWLAALDQQYETSEPPDWYAGSNTGNLVGLAFLAGSVGSGNGFATTPSASSSGGSSGSYSGGSSGGGFSGGGGGGGGGGGW